MKKASRAIKFGEYHLPNADQNPNEVPLHTTIATVKQTDNIKPVDKDRMKLEHSYFQWEYKLVQPTYSLGKFVKYMLRLSIHLSYDSTILFLI